MNDVHSLEKMNGILAEYVQQYNTRVHSSLKGKSPQQRFFEEPELIRIPSEKVIHDSFMLEVSRRVSIDAVIQINDVEYEVEPRFAKKRIKIQYTPALKEIYAVEENGDLTPITLLDKHANAVAKRNKVMLSEGSAAS